MKKLGPAAMLSVPTAWINNTCRCSMWSQPSNRVKASPSLSKASMVDRSQCCQPVWGKRHEVIPGAMNKTTFSGCCASVAFVAPRVTVRSKAPGPSSWGRSMPSMPLVGTVDERFQSYNIEMVEVIGGRFWKPYRDIDALSTRRSPPSRNPTRMRRPSPRVWTRICTNSARLLTSPISACASSQQPWDPPM